MHERNKFRSGWRALRKPEGSGAWQVHGTEAEMTPERQGLQALVLAMMDEDAQNPRCIRCSHRDSQHSYNSGRCWECDCHAFARHNRDLQWTDMRREYRIVWANHEGQHEQLVGDVSMESWHILLRLMRERFPEKFIGATFQTRADDQSPWRDVPVD
jgi:hypothetical protein